ncbi:MAG: YHS domain-containing protein [Chloroflexi bacterium RBG_16_52_11]|nr:MAG: YHS domain-containing protein [Chloroflexi bacterium RBG_16_52_11]
MATTLKDPICGMDVTPGTAAGKSEYNGQTYYFCSLGCKKAFDKEPEKYAGKGTGEQAHHH